jgi:hypothetical protein
VAVGRPVEIGPNTVVHRIGGSTLDNLRLSAIEEALVPPGISVLLGGTPQAAADQMRQAFPRSQKWHEAARIVATTTAAAIRAIGFEIVPDPTARFPNHARLIHPDGLAGFHASNLRKLAQIFSNMAES